MKKPRVSAGLAKAGRGVAINYGSSCCITSQEDRGATERQQQSHLHQLAISRLLVRNRETIRDLRCTQVTASDRGVTEIVPRLHHDMGARLDLRGHLARSAEELEFCGRTQQEPAVKACYRRVDDSQNAPQSGQLVGRLAMENLAVAATAG